MARKFMLVLLTLSFIVLASGCKGKSPEDIKVGIAGPMTGDQSRYGVDFSNGVSLAIEKWEKQGGVNGKRVALIKGDDQHDPKQAVSVANKLINDGVSGVIGHFNSSCSIPASKVYSEAGVLEITPATTNPQFTEQGLKTVFRVCGRDDQQGKTAAGFILNNLKKTRIAVLDDKTTYGQGITAVFKTAVAGKADIVYSGRVIQGDKDFKSVLASIKAAKPEVIYFGGMYPEAGLMLKQAKELGLDADWVGGDGLMDGKLLEIAGSNAEGAYITFTPDPSSIESAKGFMEQYRKKFGEPGPYSVYAYVAADVMFTALNATKSTDGKVLAGYIRANTFEGPLGTVKFSDKGDNINASYVVWQVKDGKFVQLTK
ncbi:MAG TPA: branched-chain amino acid ABC transporter substrate-binding protein [Nitrospirota bacterium]|jgi:branched-chain amino acid transport system substrate-binding protein